MFQTKVVEKIKHILRSITLFENCAIYEIMWKNILELGRSQTTTWRMHIAYWILKATNTLSEYVILTAFFHCRSGFMNTPQCYFTCTLPALF